MNKSYDVIIVGAGSVGTPTALSLAKNGYSVLVLDQYPSPGQGSNKSAIGGIRATHTHPGKILLSQDSLHVFANWKESYGDDIEWVEGGYCFVAYDEGMAETLNETLSMPQKYKAHISWMNAPELLTHIPTLNPENLYGGTYAPHDGSASPLKAILAFYHQALLHKAEFHFAEPIVKITRSKGTITGVETIHDKYSCKILVNCAGSWANEIARLTNSQLPVRPNSHEAGVTEPLAHFLDPMIVDMRKTSTTSNFYFYQHKTGQIIFCSTPIPEQWGFDTRETSEFLPAAAKRLLALIPSLASVRVRRTWRGLYPMTPDGSPLLGWEQDTSGIFIAAGMCGQGFMLGPGIASLIVRVFDESTTPEDKLILQSLNPYRPFATVESLK